MQEATTGTISDRKSDHVRLAVASDPTADGPGFADVALVHEALPELDLSEIDPSLTFLQRRLDLPLCIASMTGGYPGGTRINGALARVAQRRGLAMGVGSQRAALVDPSLRDSYSGIRREAPRAFLMANIGAPQLVTQGEQTGLSVKDVRDLVEMIEADALVVHLNPLQELIQPAGDRQGRGWLDAIARLVADSTVPVVVKETGGGISERTARRIAGVGVAAIDVGGRGGTSFAAIEAGRAREAGDDRSAALGEALGGWGIPTTVSIVIAARAGLPVIGTGGVRSGVDAAKAIALGASLVGVGRPLLQAVVEGGEAAAEAWVDRFADGLAAAMFLTGAGDPAALGRSGVIIGSSTRSWLDSLPADGGARA